MIGMKQRKNRKSHAEDQAIGHINSTGPMLEITLTMWSLALAHPLVYTYQQQKQKYKWYGSEGYERITIVTGVFPQVGDTSENGIPLLLANCGGGGGGVQIN